MIHLYIMRHGEAESRAPADHLRHLTERGRARVESMCAHLQQIDRILCSPYIRAQQTAEIVASKTGCKIETCDLITPDADPVAAINFLYKYHVDLSHKEVENNADYHLLLASHMPIVARLVEALASDDTGFFSMPTASIAYLSTDVLAKHCCELHWIKQPNL